MAKHAVSLNIVVDITTAQYLNEYEFRKILMTRMKEIIDGGEESFKENVTTEVFDEGNWDA